LTFAQEIPNVIQFLPDTYKGETQNWEITQDKNGFIYVANNLGLLEFNGVSWKTYPTPNNTIMRSVKAIGNKIYTGFYMEFGYWVRDDFGDLNYHSLTHKIKGKILEDEQFWRIDYFDNYIVFQSLNQFYVYDTESENFNIITINEPIEKSHLINKNLYYHTADGSIYLLEQGKPKLFIKIPLAVDNRIENLFYINNDWYILTQKEGFYKYSGNKLQKWQIPADDFLNKTTVYKSTLLQNGNFALGLIANGYAVLDNEGNLKETLNIDNGLSNNTVLTVFEDSKHNIWLGLDIGINVLNNQSDILYYNDLNGVLGTVYATKVFKNKLYVGTNQGLYFKTLDRDGEFQQIKNTKGQVWSLFELDGNLFCGHNLGCFEIVDGNASLIYKETGVWTFENIQGKPNLMLAGTFKGLSIFEKTDSTWKFRNNIKGFDISARFIAIDSLQNIWINHEYKGVYQLKIDDTFNSAKPVENNFKDRKQKNSGLIKFKKDIIYADKTGIYNYDYSSRKFVYNKTYSQLSDSTNYQSGKLNLIDKRELWQFNAHDISVLAPDYLSGNLNFKKYKLPQEIRKTMSGFENIERLNAKNYIIGSSTGYIILPKDSDQLDDFVIYLASVTSTDKNNKEIKHSITKGFSTDFDFGSIQFNFSVPNLNPTLKTTYQYRLGTSDVWSDWNLNSSLNFSKLAFGNYNLEVKAKIGDHVSSNTISYPFTVNRPWYLSNFSIFCYIILIVLMVYLVHKSYKNHYQRKQHHLLEDKKRQIEEIKKINEQQINKLKTDQLNQIIAQKSQELENTTVNLIKKNELLNNLKKEIKKVSNPAEVKSLLKFIEKNQDENEDWEVFESVFNRAEQDFLNNLKAKHPNLTTNDLRLCTYLKLNLSSKEIAPLLNISVRSMEIKRYRLRKKLGLEHDESLSSYILSL
jgi:ligand-binding sensor domain-containing protein/DNA-binding CsgD family transcriptional regulator